MKPSVSESASQNDATGKQGGKLNPNRYVFLRPHTVQSKACTGAAITVATTGKLHATNQSGCLGQGGIR